MRRIRDDLWETEPDAPAPGLTTHAYLWTPSDAGNVLFYNTLGDGDAEAIEQLGGVAHQYLSHQDEIGPSLRTYASRFGATLHAHASEAHLVAEVHPPEVTFERRHVDEQGIEVIPTPGHTPGSTCFVVTGHGDATYLFTGDTIYLGRDGRWHAGMIPGMSDAESLAASLELLAGLEPDLVVSSAFAGEEGAHVVDGTTWRAGVEDALARLVQRTGPAGSAREVDASMS